jgi:hypothetical protein
MFRVIPIRQQILITNNNIPNTLVVKPSYLFVSGAAVNNGATTLATPYPRIR